MAAILCTLFLVSMLSVSCKADGLGNEEQFEVQLNSTLLESLAPECNPSCINCQVLYDAGVTASGVYKIKPDGVNETKVYCEHTLTDYGTGWMVFQRRINGSVDFYRNWDNYTQGFGKAAGEFWLGLHHIYHLTAIKNAELLVELDDGTAKAYAHYSTFSIGGPNDNYRLHASGFSHAASTAGDSLWTHNGHQFSTYDADHDNWPIDECAKFHKGAWWYANCRQCNLNGLYNGGTLHGIVWLAEGTQSLPAVRMLLKTK